MSARVYALAGSTALTLAVLAGLTANPAEAKRRGVGAAIGAAAATVAVKSAIRSTRANASEARDTKNDASAEPTTETKPQPVRAATARTDEDDIVPTSSANERNVGIVCIAGC